MEFPFNVNDILSKEITLVKNKDLLQSNGERGYHNTNNSRQNDSWHNLSQIVDAMGTSSSQAQKLRGAITTSFKLKSSDDHLYIFKESQTNNGLGAIVGIIRIGCKRLFLSDLYGQQHECQPLCVLDFYVHESRQRSGYGKRLFHHMIKAENVEPCELAIDRPSPKFVNFLCKHYSLDKPIQQVNKFVVFQSFFNNMEAVGGIDANRRKSAPVHRKNMIDRKHLQSESRNANSASVTSSRQTSLRSEKLVSNALNDLAAVSPINLSTNRDNVKSDDQTSLLGDRTLQQSVRPIGSHGQRRQYTGSMMGNTSVLSNFSRHAVRQESTASPTSTKYKLPSTSDTRNHLLSRNYTVTHSRAPHKERNITSVDSPFADKPGNSTNESNNTPHKKVDQDDASYTMGLLNQLTVNRQALGTSWNVFGVPASMPSANPYSKMQKRGFP